MKKIFIIFAFVCLATSCIKQEDIVFNGIENLEISNISLSGVVVNADLNITNSSRKKVMVNDLKLRVLDNNKLEIATATLKEPVVLEKKSSQVQNVTIVAKLSPNMNPFALMALKSKLNTLMIDGYISAKAGAISRTIDIKQMNIQQLVNNFGLDK